MRRSTVLTFIRVAIGLIFAMYGTVKVLGGQYNYSDWVIDKKTTSGTSLVWAFYGYSQLYGRLTGMFELAPAILLFIPRTATIGAAALFMVSLNITAMDFAYGYPAVRYMALLYTVLLGVLLWADRHKLLLLLEDSDRARAALATLAASRTATPMSRGARRALIAAVVVFVIFAANLLASSLSGIPTALGRRAVSERVPNAQIEVLRTSQEGLLAINWTATMDFRVSDNGSVDTVRVRARKHTGFLPWRIEHIEGPSRRP